MGAAEWSGDAAAEAGGLQPAESEGAYGSLPFWCASLLFRRGAIIQRPEAPIPNSPLAGLLLCWALCKCRWGTLNPVLFLLFLPLPFRSKFERMTELCYRGSCPTNLSKHTLLQVKSTDERTRDTRLPLIDPGQKTGLPFVMAVFLCRPTPKR